MEKYKPEPYAYVSDGESKDFTGNISLRDYFAGQALAGILASPNFEEGRDLDLTAKRVALLSGIYADAMLKAREIES